MSWGLLLVAHGSHDPRAAPVAQDVAAALGRRIPGLVTQVSFLQHAEPSPETALDRLRARQLDHLLVQPFLLSAAYHAAVDLPRVVTSARRRGLAVRECPVLGPDPLLAGALVRGLEREAGSDSEVDSEVDRGFDAVVVAAAGASDPAAATGVEQTAREVGARLGIPAAAGYASAAEPTVEDAVAAARSASTRSASTRSGASRRIAVATYLLAPGFFADRIARAARKAGAVAVSEPLGAAPELVDLIAGRVTAGQVHAKYSRSTPET